MSNTLMSIETVALEAVTGGTGVKKAPAASADAALTTQLTGLSDSIKTLAQPQQNNSGNTMMMFAMAMALSRPSAPGVVYVGGRRGCW
jgi:hypothetical protein